MGDQMHGLSPGGGAGETRSLLLSRIFGNMLLFERDSRCKASLPRLSSGAGLVTHLLVGQGISAAH
jgi:hypothetical protein